MLMVLLTTTLFMTMVVHGRVDDDVGGLGGNHVADDDGGVDEVHGDYDARVTTVFVILHL